MSILKALQDAAVVAQDTVLVAENFGTVPATLRQLAVDVYRGVVHQDLGALSAALNDMEALGNSLSADTSGVPAGLPQAGSPQGAAPSIEKLKTDIRQVLTDLGA
jgi:hypothetical protein